ncbi:hypothetical protein PLESTB_001923800 [Pleodorina starrii]|uniref:AAA+ ATPase domain-containing protein n=1 Tax=Pleodorina starrii TaxID=330485 RepID=A0A9W6C2A0_9CHLO|nr:hypothetical protein PLESTB_001923800 [Pleodorina starrii]
MRTAPAAARAGAPGRGFLYSLEIHLPARGPRPARDYLKLGYSAHPEKRHRHQLGLPPEASVAVLRVVAMASGHAACACETALHRQLRRAHPDAVVPRRSSPTCTTSPARSTAPRCARPAPAWLPRLREPTGEALPDPEARRRARPWASEPAALTPRTLLTRCAWPRASAARAAVTAGPAPRRADPCCAGIPPRTSLCCAIAAPLLILLAAGAGAARRAARPACGHHEFAPIGADLVWALLEALQHLPRQGAAADRALLRQAFDSGLHLDSTDVLLALRAPTMAELAARLAGSPVAPGDAAAPPTLDSLTGDGPALQAARHLVEDLQLWRAGRLEWSEITRSALFYGPPGTGKSWLAQALAASAGVSAITGSFGEWQAAGHLGEMLKAMRRTFAEARARAPALLILDELDAVGNRGDNAGPNQNYRVQVINAFLALMDEIARAPGVIVVATCNHIDLIDPAVLRPGRFDLRVEVPLPDAATLAGVLRRHLALPEAEISVLARHCVGLSLAECDAELRAARGAARRAGVALDAAGLMARLDAGRDPAIDRRVALHECGHALVTTALGRGTVQRLALAGSGGTTRTRAARRPGSSPTTPTCCQS